MPCSGTDMHHWWMNSRRKPLLSTGWSLRWISVIREKGKLILAPNPSAPKRIQVTPHQTQLYPSQISKHNVFPHSRSAWFALRFPGPEQIINNHMPALVGMGTRKLRLRIVTWNVQGLRTSAKYDQLLSVMLQYKVDILMMQETWQTTSSTFLKPTPTIPPQTFLVLLSGEEPDKFAGVGFIIAPRIRPFVYNFSSFSSRICTLQLRTQPRPLHIYNLYAPSKVEEPLLDLKRKAKSDTPHFSI